MIGLYKCKGQKNHWPDGDYEIEKESLVSKKWSIWHNRQIAASGYPSAEKALASLKIEFETVELI